MTRSTEERLDMVEQGILRLPLMEENVTLLSKTITEMNAQIDKQYQQQQVILKYLEGILRDDSPGKQVVEGSSSKTQIEETTITALSNDPKIEEKTEEGPAMDRSKFKKVEMPIFTGTDPDSWLFRADRYFKIHNLSDSEKLTVAVISFDGPALDWYRSQEEREAFKGWQDLKQKMLVRFRSIRDDTLVGPGGIRRDLHEWLEPMVKVRSRDVEPVGLAQMMKMALKIENREMVRKECGLSSAYDSKAAQRTTNTRNVNPSPTNENTTAGGWPMRTITLREVATGENRREGPTKRLTDAEFQARREKGLCF
ncbi:transposon Tf2-1 polyprotein isoform X1 [Cucumis melo var. makuwa]|uniref:Transposon Tf2-1 polyprotein isoform X1 n=1 Tax=Cucumis melo var. makuwa TaxID=1194695 RepID=A0A5A7VLC2_CUCMM|nr:transposon Tf2-1 polyprotein isoform X1 [Cucumis melo var. makuwa]